MRQSRRVRQFLQNMARRLQPMRTHYERVEAQSNELAASRKDLAALNQQLAACRQELATCKGDFAAFRSRFSAARLGGFVPHDRDSGLTSDEKQLVDQFHDLYYRLGQRGRHTNHVSWLGYSALKCPLDLWIYHELVCRLRPEFIIETGTASGGSALFLASMCDLIDHGQVITIDVDAREGQPRPVHPRIAYLTGSSVDHGVIARVRQVLGGKQAGLVVLDSDHHRDHVLSEMRAFAPLVSPGGYLVVEDTNVNGHPVYADFGPGPMEAVKLFLAENDAFQVDIRCERFILTMNPGGFLRRVR
jgi:cephalosporin hydroxylase